MKLIWTQEKPFWPELWSYTATGSSQLWWFHAQSLLKIWGNFLWVILLEQEALNSMISKDLSNLNHSVKSRHRDLLGNHHEKFSYRRNTWWSCVRILMCTHNMCNSMRPWSTWKRASSNAFCHQPRAKRAAFISWLNGAGWEAHGKLVPVLPLLSQTQVHKPVHSSVWPLSYHLTVTQKVMWTLRSLTGRALVSGKGTWKVQDHIFPNMSNDA